MAAYAAVVSLKHTIDDVLHSYDLVHSSSLSRASLSSIWKLLYVADIHAKSLQEAVEMRSSDTNRSRSSRERLDALEVQMRDSVNQMEDSLQFHELNWLEGKPEDDEATRQEISSIEGRVKQLEKEYTEELSRDDDNKDEDDDNPAPYTDFGVEMVGRSSETETIRNLLLCAMRPYEFATVSFLGDECSFRTLVVKAVFKDARKGRLGQVFDKCVWVEVGERYESKQQLLLRIIAQLDSLALPLVVDHQLLGGYLYKLLKGRRYMIVLDDVRDADLVAHLVQYFPDEHNGSIVFFTTSMPEIARVANWSLSSTLPPGYFEESVWFGTRRGLFGIYDEIDEELELTGRKIIQNCGGSYISAAKTLLFLSENEKQTTLQRWAELAEDKENPIFIVADQALEMHKIKRWVYKSMMNEFCNKVEVRCIISKWINLSNQVEKVKLLMMPERFFPKMQIISIFGMAGIGKTYLAMKTFEDETNRSRFERHVWINAGPKCQMEDILGDLVAQIYPETHKLHISDISVDEEKFVKDLHGQLASKTSLIVLDDLCSTDPLLLLKTLFPNIKGTILVTTRLAKVAKFGECDTTIKMKLLDEEESWILLCRKVFGGESCPPQLEEVGRKIAEKCDGLPLLILTVADQLSKVEMSLEYWDNVASGKNKSVFKNAHHQISKALLPSYHGLPRHLKACFLFLGVFREKHEISNSKLSMLWISEGFLETNIPKTTKEEYAAICLSELVDTSLVMVQYKVSDFQFKTCRLHSVFWHLTNSQAAKIKFFHAIDSYDDCSIESIESQRRFAIRSTTLLGMKCVQEAMASNTSAHSFLCVNPLHQYPVPLNFETMKLLRVMNAINIRFYEFPIEVVRLIHQRYLSLTCNGKLPTSITKLRKLQYLIVKRYMNIVSSDNPAYLPKEIWDMEALRHLEVMGECLHNATYGTPPLRLRTLLGLSAQSSKLHVLSYIPELERLGIRIEMAPNGEGNYSHNFYNIRHLQRLQSFKCVVVNPQMRSEVVFQLPDYMSFPRSLKKLSLSGLGYPWEVMRTIGGLENLEVLKLKRYAFRGPKWEVDYDSEFQKLKFLLVEDTDLVHWKVNSDISMKLERLCIKHCYKLKELPLCLDISNLQKMEIVDCSTSTVTWAEQIGLSLYPGQVDVHRSWCAKTQRE